MRAARRPDGPALPLRAGDGLVTLDDWCAALPPDLPEAEPSTQLTLSRLSLDAWDVTELYAGARAARAPADPVPPAALAKFRFRLAAHTRGLSLIWTTKGSAARFDLSIWAPEVDNSAAAAQQAGGLGALLAKRSRARLCLGHACVEGIEPPGRAGRPHPLILEVADSAVTFGDLGMGSSDHLAAVVDQLLPHPIRYRLAWHSTSFKPPLYVWRPVPPSGQYLALGMLCTTTDEPPPTTAMCCVPRRWCERQATPARSVWRDEGQGGRPGSFWAVPTVELLVAGQGSEPPEEAIDCWCLREERVSTETWLVSQ